MIEIETPVYRMFEDLEGYSSMELSPTELLTLLDENPSGEEVQKVWYSYGYESYEGYGYAVVLLKSGIYQLWSLCHCSCYGPVEHQSFKVLYSLEDGMFKNTTPKAFQDFVLRNQ